MTDMRKEYRELTDDEKKMVSMLKELGSEFCKAMENIGGREAAIAKTKMEEAVMWAVKGVTA